jgi:DNA (cytosine-5)-methyltransferase 1
MTTVGSDFSGIGAFNQALKRLGIEYNEIFACDMDKYARQTFIHNYGEPKYYPTNVYEREIPTESLDIYMTSPPCQAFSLAGKRLGKNDKRGILFFNSLEFIEKNKPRFFIFENVKGLLSDDGGKTFSEWVNFLGGKSVNGSPVLFPYADSVDYHLYWKVLNAKHHGVPQNRERVFLIGIRDDKDNNFSFPADEHLTKRLKDVLESEVNEKYFLSEKMVNWITEHREKRESNNNFPIYENDIGSCVTARYFKMGAEDPYIKVKSATSKGYEEATEGDSINFSVLNSETRRGRVGKGVAETLDTQCNQGVIQLNQSKESGGQQPYMQNRVYDVNGINPALTTLWNGANLICGAIRGKGENNEQTLELNNSDYTNSITTVQKDNVIVHNCITEAIGRQGSSSEYIDSCKKVYQSTHQIRRLTPRECFRLMDFPDTFTWPVSDSQAYKQAGNSIVVNVLYKILKNLNI